MPQIQRNVDLLPYNTFRVSVTAQQFTVLESPAELVQIGALNHILTLGEGANVLFTRNFEGLVIKNEIKGRKILSEDAKSVMLEIGAGENWHDFVMFSVDNGWSGIENLAYIPGTVGAAPAMNIAAYGQTVGQVIESVKGTDLATLNNEKINADQCHFYYRDSIFKHTLKDKFIITSVVFKLSKTPIFDTNYHGRASYESLAGELAKVSPPPYSPKDVANAVVRIRQIKMPDWHKIGTAGSFFKNPFVSIEKFAALQKEMADIQAYPIDHMLYPNPDDPVFKLTNMVKIPAGRLLDELGWKGKRIGNVGTHEKHALIIVNHGGATGQEILEFSKLMQEDIKKHYEIDLEPEVNIL